MNEPAAMSQMMTTVDIDQVQTEFEESTNTDDGWQVFIKEQPDDGTFMDEYMYIKPECTIGANKPLKNHKFNCSYCDRSFPTWSMCQVHAMVHTGKWSHGCETCQISFDTSRDLKRHETTHLPSNVRIQVHVTPPDASRPKRNSPTGVNKQDPLKNHKVNCSYCDRSFPTWSMCQLHTMVHTGKWSYGCETCQISFDTSRDLKRHETTHLPSNVRIQVHVTPPDASRPKRNMKPPAPPTVFECKECPKKFTSRMAQLMHNSEHSTEEKYACKACRGVFTSDQHLQKHMKIHVNEDHEYHCDLCPRSFITSFQLKRHIRNHRISKERKELTKLLPNLSVKCEPQ